MAAKTRIYFDTEFTQFDDSRLISIGCKSQCGAEFYVELTDTYQLADCSDFVIETVLPRLTRQSAMLEAQASSAMTQWIESIKGQTILVCDAPAWDWALVTDLLRIAGWPRNLDRNFDRPDNCGFGRYGRREAEYWVKHSEGMHNALIDARAMWYAENPYLAGGIPNELQ